MLSIRIKNNVENKCSLTIKNLFLGPTLLVERTGVLHGNVIIVMAVKPEVKKAITINHLVSSTPKYLIFHINFCYLALGRF